MIGYLRYFNKNDSACSVYQKAEAHYNCCLAKLWNLALVLAQVHRCDASKSSADRLDVHLTIHRIAGSNRHAIFKFFGAHTLVPFLEIICMGCSHILLVHAIFAKLSSLCTSMVRHVPLACMRSVYQPCQHLFLSLPPPLITIMSLQHTWHIYTCCLH